MKSTTEDPNADMAKKAKFLEAFSTRKVIGATLEAMGMERRDFRSWIKADAEFRAKYEELEEKIDDEALKLVYEEVGILKKRGRRRAIDRTLLRDVLRHHPRFRPAEEKREAPAAQPIEIKGIEARILLQVVGGGINVEATALGAQALPPVVDAEQIEVEPEDEKPKLSPPPQFAPPSFTPEQIREIKIKAGLKRMGPGQGLAA